jgi:hypothetical protein
MPAAKRKNGLLRFARNDGCVHPGHERSFAFESIRQTFLKPPLLVRRVSWNDWGFTMKVWICLGSLLAATAANAQTYTTVVNREAKTVTTTGPTATATTVQTARTGTTATYTTTITRTGGYQPMGPGGYKPMGR